MLNAAVASSPISANVQLTVYFSTGFGNATGTPVVTTSTESAPQTSFVSNGELIVTVKNLDLLTLDIMASVFLTMRPIGGQGGLLVGTGGGRAVKAGGIPGR